jgi:hypothetical protein
MQSYKEIKGMAVEVKELYELKRIPLHPACSLSTLIDAAVVLSNNWDNKVPYSSDSGDITDLIQTSNAYRIAQAILSIKSESNITRHLKVLATGNLNSIASGFSEAKNFLWEVEVFHMLKNSGLNPIFVEPPDIMVSINGTTLGIACKKIYSEENFNKPLSIAAKQIKNSKCQGMVALNIDEIVQSLPIFSTGNEMSITTWDTQASVTNQLTMENVNFYNRHGKRMLSYLESTRVQAYWVHSSVIIDVQNNTPRLTNVSQGSLWNIPSIPEEHKVLLKGLYSAMQGKGS